MSEDELDKIDRLSSRVERLERGMSRLNWFSLVKSAAMVAILVSVAWCLSWLSELHRGFASQLRAEKEYTVLMREIAGQLKTAPRDVFANQNKRFDEQARKLDQIDKTLKELLAK